MSPPPSGLKIIIKRKAPTSNNVNSISEVPTGTISTGAATSTEPPAALDEVHLGLQLAVIIWLMHNLQGVRANATSLRALQVAELQAWISSNGLSMPKSKRKEGMSQFFAQININMACTDLIAAIVDSPRFAWVSKSMIEDIVEKVSCNYYCTIWTRLMLCCQRKPKKGPAT